LLNWIKIDDIEIINYKNDSEIELNQIKKLEVIKVDLTEYETKLIKIVTELNKINTKINKYKDTAKTVLNGFINQQTERYNKEANEAKEYLKELINGTKKI